MRDWSGESDDLDDDDEPSEVLPCPECGTDVYGDAEQCPQCGQYIMPNAHARSRPPWWWIAFGLAGLAALIWMLIR